GRDAPAVETGAAHLLLLDHGHVETGAGSVEGGRVPARPTADHHDVELLGDRAPPWASANKTNRAYRVVPTTGPAELGDQQHLDRESDQDGERHDHRRNDQPPGRHTTNLGVETQGSSERRAERRARPARDPSKTGLVMQAKGACSVS